MTRDPAHAPSKPVRGLPSAAELRRSRQAEDFPVVLRMLPGPERNNLRTLCDAVRTFDDVSDRTPGDPTAGLLALRVEPDRIWSSSGSGGPGVSGPAATDRRSFGEGLTERGQGAGAGTALWDLVGVATSNASAADASPVLAAYLFRQGLLTGRARQSAGASGLAGGWSQRLGAAPIVNAEVVHDRRGGEAAVAAFPAGPGLPAQARVVARTGELA